MLRHVFAEDLDTCPRCGGPMRWVEVAKTPDANARVLVEHGIQPRAPAPPVLHFAPRGHLRLDFG